MKGDNSKKEILKRRAAYREVFGANTEFVNRILTDLKRFCRMDESTFSPDQRVHAFLEGRKDVYYRMMRYLHSTEEEILNYHRRGNGRTDNTDRGFTGE